MFIQERENNRLKRLKMAGKGKNMNKYTFKNRNGETMERITKTAAKKEWLSGARVYICACNMNPASPWGVGAEICRKYVSTVSDDDAPGYWESLINEARFYNCGREAGYYLAFYKIS